MSAVVSSQAGESAEDGRLAESAHAEVVRLAERGDRLAAQEKYAEALDNYWAAWDLLPIPRTSQPSATWLLAAIGEANWFSDNHSACRDNLRVALRCPGGFGNAFLHLRLGQCRFELGELERAVDELSRAYALEGEKIFDGEDGKYLALVRSHLRPSVGG